jgi:hypothetical protein
MSNAVSFYIVRAFTCAFPSTIIISSLQVADGIYEELDSHDEKLNLGITLTPAMPSDLITSYGSISLPVTSSSSKLIKQEGSTSEENVEVSWNFSVLWSRAVVK